MRDLRIHDKATYAGSLTECHGPAKILGLHPAINGDPETRYMIVLLDATDKPIQTLSNVRRSSLK